MKLTQQDRRTFFPVHVALIKEHTAYKRSDIARINSPTTAMAGDNESPPSSALREKDLEDEAVSCVPWFLHSNLVRCLGRTPCLLEEILMQFISVNLLLRQHAVAEGLHAGTVQIDLCNNICVDLGRREHYNFRFQSTTTTAQV